MLYVESYLPTVNSWNASAQNVGGSTVGPAVYTIFRSLLDTWNFWSLVVGIFTFILLLYLVIRFREESPDDPKLDGIKPGVFPKERDNLTLELTWFIVPTILVLYLTFIAWQSMITVWVDPYSEELAEESFDITIEAYQWGWNFYYHDEIVVLNETGNLTTFVTPMGSEIKDGSIGTIHYFANGSKALPKERLEIFSSGKILQLDNFRKLRGFNWPGFKKMDL